MKAIQDKIIDHVKMIKLRIKKGVTQYEMAVEIGTMPSTIQRLESGHTKNPTITILEKIARYFDVPIEYLLTSAGFPHS